MINMKVMVYINGQMVTSMKEIGKIIKKMGKVFLLG